MLGAVRRVAAVAIRASALCVAAASLGGCRDTQPASAASVAASRSHAPQPTGVEISAADLQTRLYIFADDSMEGRATGSAGYARATAYIASELARLGLRPAGDSGGYFQRVPGLGGADDASGARNVVAVLPGADSALANEYVALGAHADHLGMLPVAVDHDSLRAINLAAWRESGRSNDARPVSPEARGRLRVDLDSLRRLRPPRRDSIANGADDDGSGSMALLEIAEALATGPRRPARSVLFVWHVGEELGMLGSAYFTEHPTVPRDSIVAQLNIDMIGRGDAADLVDGGNDYLGVVGAGRLSRALEATVERVNADQAHPLRLDHALDAPHHLQQIYCRSDHRSYARFGIPIAFFFTGLHADYHEVTDEPQYIDYPKYARITRYLADLTLALADAATRPALDGPRPDPAAPCVQ